MRRFFDFSCNLKYSVKCLFPAVFRGTNFTIQLYLWEHRSKVVYLVQFITCWMLIYIFPTECMHFIVYLYYKSKSTLHCNNSSLTIIIKLWLINDYCFSSLSFILTLIACFHESLANFTANQNSNPTVFCRFLRKSLKF